MNGRSTRPVIVRSTHRARTSARRRRAAPGNRSVRYCPGGSRVGVVALLDQFLAVAVEEAHALQCGRRRTALHRDRIATQAFHVRLSRARLRWHSMSSMPPPPPPPMSPPPGYVAYGGPLAFNGALQGDRQHLQGDGRAALDLPAAATADGLRSGQVVARGHDDSSTGRSPNSRSRIRYRSRPVRSWGLMVIPIAVLTMIWMFRMSANLRTLGRHGQTWAPGWGIASWFVPPCVIYAVPWLMFRELWKGSDPACDPSDPAWKNGRVSPLVNVWWVLYGLVPLLGLLLRSRRCRSGRYGHDDANAGRTLPRLRRSRTSSSPWWAWSRRIVYIRLVRAALVTTHAVHSRGLMLYLVRHAKAGSRHDFAGDDRLRPLSRTGNARPERSPTRSLPPA